MKYLLLLTLLYAPLSFGQSAAQLQAQLGKKEQRMWGVTLVNTVSSTILESEDYRSAQNAAFTGIFRYRGVMKGWNFRTMLAGTKDLTRSRQDRFTTAFLELSTVVKSLSNDSVTTIFQGRATPPVNDERRFQESHRGAASGGLLFIVRPPNPKFSIIGVSRVTKNFHEFQINRDFGYNTSVSLVNFGAVSYFPTDKWELGLNATNIQGWDYRGESGENSLFLGQTIGYNYSRNLIINVGHEIGGRTYGYDQDSLDISIFDSDRSSVFASLTINY
jgi:hypothetical protein